MAYIVTVSILVDEPQESIVRTGIEEMFTTAALPVEEEAPWIVDWSIGEVRPVSDELHDSIINETYRQGEGFGHVPASAG